MKVSIIIPVYNTEKYLEKCLNSVTNQTYQDLEIIIINDGSTDSSETIIKKYADKSQQIKYLKQKNAGQSRARNNGLKAATGDLIVFLDSDDFLDTNMISKLIKPFEEDKNIELTFCNYYMYYSEDKIIKNQYFQNSISDLKKAYLIEPPGPAFKMYKKSLLKNFTFPEGIIYEDLACVPYLIAKAKKIAYIDEYLYYYRQHTTSTINNHQYSNKKLDILKASALLCQKFNTKDLEEYQEEIEFLLIKHLFYYAGLRFYRYHKPKSKLKLITDFKDKYLPNYQDNYYYQNLLSNSEKKAISKILANNVLYCYLYSIKLKFIK